MSADVERYTESSEHLPEELHDHLLKTRILDAKIQAMERDTDRLMNEFLNSDFPSLANRQERRAYFDGLDARVREHDETERKLTEETYALAQESIKRLDESVGKLAKEIRKKAAKRRLKIMRERDEKRNAQIANEINDAETIKNFNKANRNNNSIGTNRNISSNNVRSSESVHTNDNKNSNDASKNSHRKSTRSSTADRKSGSSSTSSQKSGSSQHGGAKKSSLSERKHKRGVPNVSSDDEDWIRGAYKKQRLISSSSNDEYDIPVDPDEPLYCICNKVSYGNMVACDGDECSIEWFHFECVGLKVNPKGNWYCGKCREMRRKKQ